jgi:hypothetical protein
MKSLWPRMRQPRTQDFSALNPGKYSTANSINFDLRLKFRRFSD